MKFYEMKKCDFRKLKKLERFDLSRISSLIVIPSSIKITSQEFCYYKFAIVDYLQEVIGVTGRRDLAAFTALMDNLSIKLDVIPCGYVRIFTSSGFNKWRNWW